jgi:D-tagatose-1,6-bisphosphate aldolase subunit GatZ/KbaZ
VRDGFAILKVGPGLTFALREALYGLDRIAEELDGDRSEPPLQASMEAIMVSEPKHWRAYYHGNERDLYLQRHFSYSDRIRYYWPSAEARAAVERMLARLGSRRLLATLVSQYLGALGPAVAAGQVEPEANQLLLAAVRHVLAGYSRACRAS